MWAKDWMRLQESGIKDKEDTGVAVVGWQGINNNNIGHLKKKGKGPSSPRLYGPYRPRKLWYSTEGFQRAWDDRGALQLQSGVPT